jgi:thiamine transport system ATP-binding protein
LLQVENLVVEQGAFRLAADMTLRPERRYGVIGPSGSGKSTLLAALCGFLTPTRGRLLWNGQDITATPPRTRPMTMLFQDNNLFPHLTVTQNAGLGIRPDLKLDEADRARVAEALDRVGLSAHAEKRPAALSGGQQSRAALARVLVQARPWVLLDEPFAALGPMLRREMLDLVQALVRETGAGLLMVTHAPDDLRRIAQEAIFVADGRAAPPEPAEALLDDPPPALRAYLG